MDVCRLTGWQPEIDLKRDHLLFVVRGKLKADVCFIKTYFYKRIALYLVLRAVARALIGGGGGGVYIHIFGHNTNI